MLGLMGRGECQQLTPRKQPFSKQERQQVVGIELAADCLAWKRKVSCCQSERTNLVCGRTVGNCLPKT